MQQRSMRGKRAPLRPRQRVRARGLPPRLLIARLLIARLLIGLALAGAVLACTAPPPPRDPGALAAAYASAGRYEEAAREIDLAVRAHPEDPALRRRAADLHARAGDLERAVGHLEVALSLSPRDPEISIQLGELERERQNLADAYVAFRRAAELDPDDLRAVSGLALSAEALGFDDEAEAAFARWAELERRGGAAP